MKKVFVALEIPSSIKLKIQKEIVRISKDSYKSIPTNNWHITLLYIGEARENNLKDIYKNFDAIKFPNFNITCKKIKKHKNMLWVDIEKSKANDLTELLRKKYKLRHINRSYKPHINLGKIHKDIKPKVFELSWIVKDFHVFESRLLPKGVKYYKIKSFKLY
ncbi:MAG: RNA 2',3'-cyclic phosphodiesterase [bacterium]